ncbi:E3 ubiquitin/ISG15 ligase TRIM25-like [Rhinophrynus dorsalis]
MASADLRDELKCSICLNVYTDPVMLRCGHNFCLVCIGSILDIQDGFGVYSCPECRAEFKERLALQRNIKLCNIVECFLKTHPEKEETGVFCTYCIHSAVPAVKMCPHCEALLCDDHLRVHSKSPEHMLAELTTSLRHRKCSIHRELLKYYCTEDGACICVSCCLAGEHKGHPVELLKEASEKKKEAMRHVLEKLTSKRKETENGVKSLQEHRREVQRKAAGLSERVTAMFRGIRDQLEVREKRVLSEVSRQVEQVSLQVSDVIQQLELKKEELSSKIYHIEELCGMTDPLTVLQSWESDTDNFGDIEEGDDKEKKRNEKNNHVALDMDKALISVTLHKALNDIVTGARIHRLSYMHEASDLLLDANTAGKNVVVSGDLKTASWTGKDQSWTQTPTRFLLSQVLSIKNFSSGQHYWEVETSRSGPWRVGMAYPSIERQGAQSLIGNNKNSWCVSMYNNEYCVINDFKVNRINPEIPFQGLGIFLDYEAERLTFYQLCDPIRHLYTFTVSFTKPLHAMFSVGRNAWVRLRS